jgi:hypothetical protein
LAASVLRSALNQHRIPRVMSTSTWHEKAASLTFDDKQSGNARDKCFDSLVAYTQQKSTWVKLV